MSSFRKRLLTDVSRLCKSLFTHRVLLVRQQQLVSEKAKEDISALALSLDGLRRLQPFPREVDVDETPLQELRTMLERPDVDPVSAQDILMEWVQGVNPSAGSPGGETAGTSPLNQRMIDGLASLRSAIDNTRVRLILAGEPYDEAAYTSARNSFTLSRSVYAERLRLGQIECTNAEVAEVEQDLHIGIAEASGGDFPGSIQAAADFMEARAFPEALVKED